jgi:hypothetical protein
VLYPDISRQNLEIQAAENYLEATWGIRRKQSEKPPSQDKIQKKAIAKNTNPILGYKDLKKELQKAHNSDDAIKEAVGRAIKAGEEPGKLPWPMGGCAAEYQIVEAQAKRGNNQPTQSGCKYQKIYRDNEN